MNDIESFTERLDQLSKVQSDIANQREQVASALMLLAQHFNSALAAANLNRTKETLVKCSCDGAVLSLSIASKYALTLSCNDSEGFNARTEGFGTSETSPAVENARKLRGVIKRNSSVKCFWGEKGNIGEVDAIALLLEFVADAVDLEINRLANYNFGSSSIT